MYSFPSSSKAVQLSSRIGAAVATLEILSIIWKINGRLTFVINYGHNEPRKFGIKQINNCEISHTHTKKKKKTKGDVLSVIPSSERITFTVEI